MNKTNVYFKHLYLKNTKSGKAKYKKYQKKKKHHLNNSYKNENLSRYRLNLRKISLTISMIKPMNYFAKLEQQISI